MGALDLAINTGLGWLNMTVRLEIFSSQTETALAFPKTPNLGKVGVMEASQKQKSVERYPPELKQRAVRMMLGWRVCTDLGISSQRTPSAREALEPACCPSGLSRQ
jgi:hypothetical protein